MSSTSSYWRDVEQLASEEGWTVERTSGGHLALKRAGTPTVFASSTPGNAWRTLNNLRAELRRKAREADDKAHERMARESRTQEATKVPVTLTLGEREIVMVLSALEDVAFPDARDEQISLRRRLQDILKRKDPRTYNHARALGLVTEVPA